MVDLLKKGNIDFDMLLVPKIDIKHEKILRKQDQIIEQLKKIDINPKKDDVPCESNL